MHKKHKKHFHRSAFYDIMFVLNLKNNKSLSFETSRENYLFRSYPQPLTTSIYKESFFVK